MRRKDVSLTIALSASLVGHGAVIWLAVESFGRAENERLGSFARLGWAHINPDATETNQGLLTPLLPPPTPDREQPPPEKLLEPTPPLPPPPPERPEIRPAVGDSIGGGQASNRTPGEQPMQARQSDAVQADLGVTPPNPNTAGSAGAGGTPGNPGASASPASPPTESTPPAQPTPPTPKPQPQTSADGLMKEGGASPEFGTGKALPTPPRLKDAPLPPTIEQKQRSDPNANEADQRNQSRGQSPDNPTPKETPDATGNAAPPPQSDNRKPTEQDRPNPPAPPQDGKPQPERPGENLPPSQGPKVPAVQEERKEGTRPESSSQRPESPKGDENSQQDRNRPGITPPPNQPTPKVEDQGQRPIPPTPQSGKSPDNSDSPKPQDKPTETPESTQPPEPQLDSAAAQSAQAAAQKAAEQKAAEQNPSEQKPTDSSTPSTPSTAAQPGNNGNGGDGLAPGLTSNPGENSVQSDTESDPFSKVGSVTFRAGRVDARFGRKVKWVKPRLSLAGQIDAGFSGNAFIILSVSTDATGKVTRVEVLQSSGSPDSVDLPVVRAVYAWWIEPPKNSKGEPTPDTMVWRIVLRS